MKNSVASSKTTSADHARVRKYLDLLERHRMPGDPPRVLDFGCGDGHFTRAMIELGVDAYGADIDTVQVGRGQEKFRQAGLDPDRLRPMELSRTGNRVSERYRLPYPDGFFHGIMLIQVLEHVWELEPVLDELSRVLVPGGLVYTEYPSSYCPVEPHLALPFVHFLPHSKLRARTIGAFYALGVGRFRAAGGARQNDYLADSVFYRPHAEIDRALSARFTVESVTRQRLVRMLGARGLPRLPGIIMHPLAKAVETLFERSQILRKPA